MSAEQVGAYIRLICYQWDNGPLPNDDKALSRLAGCSVRVIAGVRQKFSADEAGNLVNQRLEKVREEQRQFSSRQAENAKKRWGKAEPDACQNDATAYATAYAKPEPDACSASASASANTNKDSATHPDPLAALPPVLDTEAFRKSWAEYIAHRKDIRAKPLKPRSIKAQLDEMASWGEQAAIEAIGKTIRNNWQGIFQPDAKKPNAHDKRSNDRSTAHSDPYREQLRAAGL